MYIYAALEAIGSIFLLHINLQGIEFVCKMVCVTSHFQILEREPRIVSPSVRNWCWLHYGSQHTWFSSYQHFEMGCQSCYKSSALGGWCVQEMYYVQQRVFICGTFANYASQPKFHFTFCKKYLALTMLCKRTTYRIVEII
jgi:hypothetical protein